jgi:ABC-2 type transport system permease protein
MRGAGLRAAEKTGKMMRTLKNIWALMLKEFRSLFTDPVLLVLITFMFTGSIINTAKGISTDVKNATVGIIDQDRSQLSMRIRDAIQAPFFKLPQDVRREEVDALMDKGEYIFILEIPPNFERDVQAGRSPNMQLLVDATVMSQAGVGASYLSQIINREVNSFAGISMPVIITPVVNTQFNPNGESAWSMPVSQVGSNAAMIMLILVGAAVIRERERGTIEHLLVMPVSSFELMMSKIIANGTVIMAAALASMWLVVHFYLGVPIKGSLLLYSVGMMLYLFCLASMGVMLATVAPSMAQFGLLMMPIYMVMMLFSGSASPRSNMPAAAQWISAYWPMTQFMKFAQNIMFRGAGIGIVWPQMVALALLGVAFLGFALIRFRRMLEQQS